MAKKIDCPVSSFNIGMMLTITGLKPADLFNMLKEGDPATAFNTAWIRRHPEADPFGGMQGFVKFLADAIRQFPDIEGRVNALRFAASNNILDIVIDGETENKDQMPLAIEQGTAPKPNLEVGGGMDMGMDIVIDDETENKDQMPLAIEQGTAPKPNLEVGGGMDMGMDIDALIDENPNKEVSGADLEIKEELISSSDATTDTSLVGDSGAIDSTATTIEDDDDEDPFAGLF